MNGDSSEAAAKVVVAHAACPSIRLVHGEVIGTGGAVVCIPYGHARVELGDAVIDPSNGRCVVARRRDYYAAGQASALQSYTFKEARQWMLRTRHYGPWENTTETTKL